MHAFIIEDDYLIRHALADMLGEMGFSRFGFARSEDAAIAGASATERIDLITADVRLLPGEGLKAVQTICKQRTIPVIFITGFADDLEGRLSGIEQATILQKPIKAEELAAAVRKVLGRSDPPEMRE